MSDGGPSEPGRGGGTIRQETIDPRPEDSYIELVELIADLEGVEMEELPSLYRHVDDLIQDLFQNPPPPEAEVQIEFTYCGYRINMDQAGTVSLMELPEERRGS